MKALACEDGFSYCLRMSTKQSQDKLDKRAAALRENLRKRKPAAKKSEKSKDDGNVRKDGQ